MASPLKRGLHAEFEAKLGGLDLKIGVTSGGVTSGVFRDVDQLEDGTEITVAISIQAISAIVVIAILAPL